MSQRQESCGRCHWLEFHVGTGGFCRRFPPAIVLAPAIGDAPPRIESYLPYVAENDFCGEWRAAR